MTLLFLFDEGEDVELGILQRRYHQAAILLLPPGRAWNRNPESNMGKLHGSLQWEMARVHLRLEDWKRETLPSTANEMLDEWEEFVGLPDECFPIAETIADRQAQVVAKFLQSGDQSVATYISLAAALGYAIAISKYTLFQPNFSKTGDKVYSERIKFARIVTTQSGAQDSLLACALRAHAHLYGRLDFVFT